MIEKRDIPELLAPAGDREAFLAAVAAGADAIYCGVTGQLNARRRAGGIAPKELPELCELAHEHGVRVYVTMNVVVKQAELAGALAAAGATLDAGADALIIQDLGFLAAVHEACPGAEIHVSTQANVHDARGVRLCEELGAARVTLSRELPLKEIARIAAETSAELEVFSHGAICPSYSGVCMLSSFLREGRSPNRGLCAQPCRLPFDLVGEDGTRLQPNDRERALCTHDNCVIDDLAALAGAGVASLKLEGRMKPAAYVWAVTSAYRAALDELPGNGAGMAENGASEAVPGMDARRTLKRSFNRGLTDAYLHGMSGNELMSYERSGNRGELVGRLVDFAPEPGFVPRDGQQVRGTVTLALTASVDAGDSLELRPVDDPERFMVVVAPESCEAGGELRCRVPRPMPAGCEVRLTRSVAIVSAAAKAVSELERQM